MEQSVPKRRDINISRRGITQKKAYNIQNMAKVWNQENKDITFPTPVNNLWYTKDAGKINPSVTHAITNRKYYVS